MRSFILGFIFETIIGCKTVVVIHGVREGPEELDVLKQTIEQVYH